MAPRQNTFTVVPNPLGVQGLISREDVGVASKPPMTSKQAQKLYRQATKQPRLSKAEQRRIEREEQERIRKDLEKDKQAAKARAAREKKKAKEQKALDDRRKKGMPLVDVHPSQDTISRFVRGNGLAKKRDSTGAPVHLETVHEDDRPAAESEKENQPPAKKQRTDHPPSQHIYNTRNSRGNAEVGASIPRAVVPEPKTRIAPRAQPISQLTANNFESVKRGLPTAEEMRRMMSIIAQVPALSLEEQFPEIEAHIDDEDVVFLGESREPITNAAVRPPEPKHSALNDDLLQISPLPAPLPPTLPPTLLPTLPPTVGQPASALSGTTDATPQPSARGEKPSKEASNPNSSLRSPPQEERQSKQAREPAKGSFFDDPALETRQYFGPKDAAPEQAAPLPAPVPKGHQERRCSFSGITQASNGQGHPPQPKKPTPVVRAAASPVPSVKPSSASTNPLKRVNTPAPSRPAMTPISTNTVSAHPPAQTSSSRPTRPAPPAFKPMGAASRPITQTPKFLPKHHKPPPKPVAQSPSYPLTANGRHVQGTSNGGMPTSTQIFLATHIDELLPTPSQEARELSEAISLPPVPPKPPFKRPPVPLFKPNPPKPNPAPYSRPLSKQTAVVDARPRTAQNLDDFSFLSTQDLVLSTQDIRDVEQDTGTASKPTDQSGASKYLDSQRSWRPPFITNKATSHTFATSAKPLTTQGPAKSIDAPHQFVARSSPRTVAVPDVAAQRNPTKQASSAAGPQNPRPTASKSRYFQNSAERSFDEWNASQMATHTPNSSSTSLPSLGPVDKRTANPRGGAAASSIRDSQDRPRFFGSSGAGLCELQTMVAMKESAKTFAEEQRRRKQLDQLDTQSLSPAPSKQETNIPLDMDKHGKDRRTTLSQIAMANNSDLAYGLAIGGRQPKSGLAPSQESDYGDFDLDAIDWPAL